MVEALKYHLSRVRKAVAAAVGAGIVAWFYAKTGGLDVNEIGEIAGAAAGAFVITWLAPANASDADFWITLSPGEPGYDEALAAALGVDDGEDEEL